jgi:hypothetical protein
MRVPIMEVAARDSSKTMVSLTDLKKSQILLK